MIHIFIINPEAGADIFSEELREHIKQRENFKYFIFTTHGPGDEYDLVNEVLDLFEDEELRIYCCGGSGTIRNVLNGLHAADFDRVELAFFACGLTNDFLKAFGEDRKYFKDIDAIIDGDAIPIDYIESNYGRALNVISFGADSLLLTGVEKYRYLNVFHRMMPYICALIRTLVLRESRDFNISIDDSPLVTEVSEMAFGNGGVIGGMLWYKQNPDFMDGKAEYAINGQNGIELLKTTIALIKKDEDKARERMLYGKGAHIKIEASNGKEFGASFDGELVNNIACLDAHMVQKGLRFVIPKGVKIDER